MAEREEAYFFHAGINLLSQFRGARWLPQARGFIILIDAHHHSRRGLHRAGLCPVAESTHPGDSAHSRWETEPDRAPPPDAGRQTGSVRAVEARADSVSFRRYPGCERRRDLPPGGGGAVPPAGRELETRQSGHALPAGGSAGDFRRGLDAVLPSRSVALRDRAAIRARQLQAD